MLAAAFFLIIGAYLAGSIPVAYLGVRALTGSDIRSVGSGNVGGTNAIRVVGFKLGALLGVLDVLKSALPTYVGVVLLGAEDPMVLAVAAAAVAGHNWPVFLRFQGGKGIASTIGVGLILFPQALLIAVVVAVLLVAATRFVSLGSLALTGLLPAILWFRGGSVPLTALAVVLAVTAYWQHRGNIKRLFAGTERRFGQGDLKGSIVAEEEDDRDKVQVYRTVCPRNCFGTCGLLAHVRKGRIVKVTGDPLNKATSGNVCAKGLTYPQRVYAQDRLLNPLKRSGPRGSGEFTEITWEEALSEISATLRRVRAESGPESVLYYAYSGASGLMDAVSLAFWRLFGGYTTTHGSLCWAAGLEATRLTYGRNIHSAPWDIRNAGTIVLWGKNPAYTNVHQMRFIYDALDAGARLVVIDPIRTASADRSHLHLQPRPGTDGALALALGRELIAMGAVDEDFVASHTVGYDDYRDLTENYTLEDAQERTGVPAAKIRQLAEMIAANRPLSLVCGYGLQRYDNGGQTVRAISLIPALLGDVGVSGGGWYYANLQSAIDGGLPLPEKPGQVRSVPVGRLATALNELSDPPLRVAWIQKANPVIANPNTNLLLRGLERLDLIVVVEQFMTDTARNADLVLPAATLFEQTDVNTGYWHSYIQIRDKIIDPPGSCRPEYQIFRDLAQGFAMPLEFFPKDSERALNDLLAQVSRVTLDDLRKGPHLAPWDQEIA